MIEESCESDKKKSKISKKNKKDDEDFDVGKMEAECSSSDDQDVVQSSFSEAEEPIEKKKKK